VVTAPAQGSADASIDSRRVDWLDGVRGAAALFVVLHHAWLAVWPEFPRNAGPWWLGWLLYGHLAVAVFIVVSGFSLALAPLRRGGTLSTGARGFLRRRAWRILPPYWAALVFSTILAAFAVQPHIPIHALVRSFVVHGFLVQDAVGSVPPNGAFWSIAVEWQIYFVFPVILWLGRRSSLATAVTTAVALVIVAHGLAGTGSPWSKIDHLTPQFLALFALGVGAVQLARGGGAARRRALTLGAIIALGTCLAGALGEGSVWMVGHYFWVDIVFGTGVACVMSLMYGGGVPSLRAVLASRTGRRLGLFSYSIYLLHAPLVGVLYQYVFGPAHLAPLLTFALIIIPGVPAILALCYGFHLVFEAPFLHHRDAGALRAMPLIGRMLPRPGATVGAAPVLAPAPVGADALARQDIA
jgi:peptidoglycan/LPS O-acetylase OafA/YrhL